MIIKLIRLAISSWATKSKKLKIWKYLPTRSFDLPERRKVKNNKPIITAGTTIKKKVVGNSDSESEKMTAVKITAIKKEIIKVKITWRLEAIAEAGLEFGFIGLMLGRTKYSKS
jgi:hypothetical protein